MRTTTFGELRIGERFTVRGGICVFRKHDEKSASYDVALLPFHWCQFVTRAPSLSIEDHRGGFVTECAMTSRGGSVS